MAAATSGYAGAFAVNFGLNLRWVFVAERRLVRRVAPADFLLYRRWVFA